MFAPKSYILLIDDDNEDLEILSTSLELEGLKTKSFDSANKAITYLRLASETLEMPLLIISDYNMPEVNGQEFLESIRKVHATKEIPVVFYSTGMSKPLETALLTSGALACFPKPWNRQESVSFIEKFKQLANTELSHHN